MKKEYIPQIIEQHSVESVKKWIGQVFDFSQVKRGDFKKGQGDIVVINLGNGCVDFREYMEMSHMIKEIKTDGIYTNIFWSRDFFTMVTSHITGK